MKVDKTSTFLDYLPPRPPALVNLVCEHPPIRIFPIFKALCILKVCPIFDEFVKLLDQKLGGKGVLGFKKKKKKKIKNIFMNNPTPF